MTFYLQWNAWKVSHLEISPVCFGSMPCKHYCTITLSDGQKKNIYLEKTAVCTLIEAVARDKISYTVTTLTSQDPGPDDQKSSGTPEDVLTEKWTFEDGKAHFKRADFPVKI